MQIPSAGFIEIAVDQVKAMSSAGSLALKDQQRELEEAKGTVSDDFSAGYALGVQVARVLIETSPLLAIKGVKAEDVL